MRIANRKHQDSPEGKLDHRDRQRVYRAKCRLQRVTDHTSARRPRSVNIKEPWTKPRRRPPVGEAFQPRRRLRGSDSKGARAHAKGRLSVFLASLDLLTSFSQGTIRRHECFGASHNRYPKLGLSNQRTTTERDHGASIDLLRRRVGQISRLSRGNPSRRPHPRFHPDRCRPGSSGQSPGGGESGV